MATYGEVARKMPYSIEAEQSVLGCILISGTVANELCSKLNEDNFYSTVHQTIFSCMKSLNIKNQPVDYVTLVSELERTKKLNEVGGINYITSLTNAVPTAANYEHYTDILLEDSKLRKLLEIGNTITAQSYENKPSGEIIDFVEKALTDIATSKTAGLVHIKEAVDTVDKKFESIAKDPNAVTGLKTDLYALDNIFNGGLHGGDLVLIAARPGVGKTSLGMNIVANAALNHNATCAVFSLEMPKEQLAQRMLCSVASVDMSAALKGELTSEDWTALWAAKKQLVESKIFVDDNSMTNPGIVRNECLKLKRAHGLDLVMIDYVQLMSSMGGSKNNENRQQEISNITRFLKIAAKELDVPILLLSQLSRAVEGRADHRPMLSDLRESGAIEQDADIVMFIYNPDIYTDENAIKPGIVDIIVAKHRNGSIGTVKLKFNKCNTTFTNRSEDADAQSLENSMPKQNKKKLSTDGVDVPPDIVPMDESGLTDGIF
jgi:replicative DNA helicase